MYGLTCTVLVSPGEGSGAPVLTQANRITNDNPIINSVTQEINPCTESIPATMQGSYIYEQD